jgi:hypothetical protein
MATDILTATVTAVPFGNLEIEGLLLQTGEFAVAQQQVASLFQVIPTSAPKWLEYNLGKGYSLFQIKTNREKIEGKRVRSTENALSLLDFEKLIVELTIKGNPIAANFTRQLVGLSLTQIFSDAFSIRFEKEERQAYLQARPEGKVTRRTMTDAIKAWCNGH